MHRQHDDLDVRMILGETLHHLKTVQPWHGDILQYDLRLAFLHPLQDFPAIADFVHHLDTRNCFKQPPDTSADQAVIVCQQY